MIDCCVKKSVVFVGGGYGVVRDDIASPEGVSSSSRPVSQSF